jgi:hypothetical protein
MVPNMVERHSGILGQALPVRTRKTWVEILAALSRQTDKRLKIKFFGAGAFFLHGEDEDDNDT